MDTTIIGEPRIRNIEFATFGETVLSPVALYLTLAMALLIILIDRKYAIVPMLIIATAITNMQRLVIGSFDFDMLRILILAAMFRVVARNEVHAIRFNAVDWMMLLWLMIRFTAQLLLWKTQSRLVYNLGFTFNAVGMYYLTRMFIRTREDVRVLFITLMITTFFVSGAMLTEQLTGRNLFGLFGGVPMETFVREGRLRSQAAFSHPILAGSFGAAMLPIAWGLLHDTYRFRWIGRVGLFTSFLIVLTAASSGPVMALAAGLFGIFMWRYQIYTRGLFWLGIIGLFILNLYMQSPIYALIWRVGVVGGSTGFHRYQLIHQAVQRFNEWWLIGTYSSAHWGWGLQDVTNMFIRQGIDGGVFAMIAFAVVNFLSFRAVAMLVRRRPYEYASMPVWALGVSLLTHLTSFFGVSYFGQMIFFWYITIAMISSLWQYEAAPEGISLLGSRSVAVGTFGSQEQ